MSLKADRKNNNSLRFVFVNELQDVQAKRGVHAHAIQQALREEKFGTGARVVSATAEYKTGRFRQSEKPISRQKASNTREGNMEDPKGRKDAENRRYWVRGLTTQRSRSPAVARLLLLMRN
jgi:hypothetical protein